MGNVKDLERALAWKLSESNVTRAASAKRRIPFIWKAQLAGWGPFENLGDRRACREDKQLPLWARAFVLEYGGQRVALCSVDLHGGSRWISERVAQLRHAQGFDISNVYVCGTHNHSGPAGLYASQYFDPFGASHSVYAMARHSTRIGFNESLAEHIANQLADAIYEAVENLEDARLAFTVGRLYDFNINRSFDAFRENFPGKTTADIKRTLIERGLVDAGDTRPLGERHAVDNRVRTLCAVDEKDPQNVLGLYSTWASHNAIQHRRHQVQSSDCFGFAALQVEDRLKLGRRACVLAAGSIGDSDPQPPGMSRAEFLAARNALSRRESSKQLIQPHGDAVASVIVSNVEQAKRNAQPLTRLACAYSEEVIAEAKTASGCLAEVPRVGTPTFGGSELGRGPGSVEGSRFTYLEKSVPHSPKLLVSRWPTNGLALWKTRAALQWQYPRLPLRLLELGFAGAPPVRLLSLPGEPTTMLSLDLMARVGVGGANTMLCAVTGDYVGYLTTTAEYCAQHYEGSSTIWGRLTGEWLHERAEELRQVLAGERAPAQRLAKATFDAWLETWPTQISGNEGTFGDQSIHDCPADDDD